MPRVLIGSCAERRADDAVTAPKPKPSRPTEPGWYRLRTPEGRVLARKVIEQSGELYVLEPRGWVGTAAVPLRQVAGTWAEG